MGLRLSYIFLISLITCFNACGPNLPADVAHAYQQLPDEIDFNFHVRPILSDRCSRCHGPDEKVRKADLRLDKEETAFAKLSESSGFAFVPGKPDQSVAVHKILSTDSEIKMPPPESKMSLTAQEKATIVKWIEQGAEWKQHWSFIAPEKKDLPVVQNLEWVRNPIDRFILTHLEREGIHPSEEATKENLIRRLTLDLTGLLPSLEEIDNFLTNHHEQAYEEVIDRLLASPKFGERWSWDWLDAARYADTNGFQNDPERKMWPWRDWVIQVINDNMPYDQFTIEQLAGDLIPNASVSQIIATGFNRNHTYNGEGGRIPEETRVENVFDRVETMGTIWLGLTLTCTRCHDHKFDPLTQQEYYQFFDYFNQTSEAGENGNGMIKPVLDLSPPLEKEQVEKLQKFVDQISEKVTAHESIIFPHEEGQTPAESPAAANLVGDNLLALSTTPSKRGSFGIDLLKEVYKNVDVVYTNLLVKLKDAIANRNKAESDNLQVMIMDELDQSRTSFILQRGAYDKHGEEVTLGVPSVLPTLPDNAPANRLGLANWIVSPDHPLTARVTVNRFWQSFFGNGLVKSTDDFGVQGDKPTHPELLDWLAVDFIESNWDVKALFKKIVMSATYRQSSKMRVELLEKDPDNRLLARSSRYRLPSWMLRDNALFISGLLVDSIGGSPVNPYQPAGIWEEATFGVKKFEQDHGNDLYRRTIYTFWRRIVGPTMLFDNSPRQVCSVKPSRTNTPLHALTTLNDVTFVEASRVMAERIMAMSGKDDERIDLAFRLATSRFPNTEEKAVLTEGLQKLKNKFENQHSDAEKLTRVGEYRTNHKLEVKEHAAYTAFCSMILNLDETITKQ